MFADVVKQLPSRHILHNHEEICGCTYYLVPTTQTYNSFDMELLHINYQVCINQKVIIIGQFLFTSKPAQPKCTGTNKQRGEAELWCMAAECRYYFHKGQICY